MFGDIKKNKFCENLPSSSLVFYTTVEQAIQFVEDEDVNGSEIYKNEKRSFKAFFVAKYANFWRSWRCRQMVWLTPKGPRRLQRVHQTMANQTVFF